MRKGPPTSTDAVIGAIAGIAATIAMTIAADRLFRRLPEAERYPLPPRQLTERAAGAVWPRDGMSETTMQAATLAGHFGFGAAAGSLYALVFRDDRGAIPRGIAYGLAVWVASYLGWIPGMRLLRPATDHPARRNALMLSVHVVWGGTLGFVVRSLRGALTSIRAGPLREVRRPPG